MAYPKGLEQHHLTLSKDVSASACWTNHSSSVRGETIILWSEQRASFPEHWDQHKWRPLDALSPEDLGKTQRFSDWDEMNSEVSTGWLRSLCWKSCLLISLEPYILLSAQHFNLFSGFLLLCWISIRGGKANALSALPASSSVSRDFPRLAWLPLPLLLSMRSGEGQIVHLMSMTHPGDCNWLVWRPPAATSSHNCHSN